MLKLMLARVMASGRSSRFTSSGCTACQAGPLRAAPVAMRKVKRRMVQGAIAPKRVRSPRARAAKSIQACATRSTRRRSRTSAKAPAGSERKNIGRLEAACTSATMVGDEVSVVIVQEAPTFWNQVPRFEKRPAIQSAR